MGLHIEDIRGWILNPIIYRALCMVSDTNQDTEVDARNGVAPRIVALTIIRYGGLYGTRSTY